MLRTTETETGLAGTETVGRRRRPRAVLALVALLVFQGLGAVEGGAVLVADPSGAAMGWDTGFLERTPFGTFLWPGLILGVGLGVTALLLAFGVWTRAFPRLLATVLGPTGHHWSWAGSLALGVGLMAWIVVQVTITDVRSFLQPLMFAVGAAIAVVACLPAVRDHLVVVPSS